MTSVLVVYRNGVLVPEAELAGLREGDRFVVELPLAALQPEAAPHAPVAEGEEESGLFHWLDGKWGRLEPEVVRRLNGEEMLRHFSGQRPTSTWLL
ncbi:MAG: hypothetical protein NZ528_10245 [Caldilineales bacterium]|nr:hypothetical protein [Caldilineales bacterium]MDW8317671.1 hypothetical protein [Anaerolineae bacterium]